MTDRDHFAAAALTGLLFHNHEPPKPVQWWVEQAYDYADAMLRERAKHSDRPGISALPVPLPIRAEVSISGVIDGMDGYL